MKSKIYKILMGTITFMLMFLVFNIKAEAANCNVSVSSVSGSKDETVVVNVTVTTDEAAAGQIGISYDTNFLDYAGSDSGDVSGGQAGIILIISADIPTSGYTVPLKFKLKEPGSTAVTVAENTKIYAQVGTTDEPMNYNAANGTVTIAAATTASSDSKLSGLSIQAVTSNGDSSNVVYTPAFSPDITEYKADLAANVTRLVVATTLSDSKSQTAVSGTRIDPGNNKTTVTVTAEDGSVTKYILYTTRAVESTTEPSSSEEDTSETTETFDRTPKKVKDLDKYIIQDFTLTTIPEGFEEGIATYEGETIAVLRGIAKPLALVCLADDAQGTNIEKYIYNEISGAMDKMIDITSMQKMYTIIPTGDTYVGPEGYTQTELEINGNKIKAWVKSAESDFYIIYAMNWNGETSLYAYDIKEQTMQRFVEGNKTENITDIPEEEDKEYLLLKKQYNEMYDEYVNDHQKKNKQIVALGIIIILVVIMAGIVIYLLYRKGPKNFQPDNSDDLEEIGEAENGENKEKELKLDFVAQVNETKPEQLAEVITEIMEDGDEIGFEAELENKNRTKEIVSEKVMPKEHIKEEINQEAVEDVKSDKKAVENAEVSKAEYLNKESELGSREEIKASASDILDALNTQSLKNVIEETNKVLEEEDEEPIEIEFFDLDD